MAKKPTRAEQAEAERDDDEATARDAQKAREQEDKAKAKKASEGNGDDDAWNGGSSDHVPEDDGAEALRGGGDSDGVVKVAVVPAPPEEGAFVAGEALTPEQKAGLEPLDREKDNEQAEDREHLINMQTDHERENALDPTSSDPNPGVTPDTPHTSAATGAPPSDMSGRPPLSDQDKKSLQIARDALSTSRSDDQDKGGEEERHGWRTPQEIGVAGGVMARLQSLYPERIEVETVPNGHFFPETGKRYRLK